ncbi:MAG: T9SS type A sorting domain-containing protein [Microscillaceae bacterium]|nr:T9SS type A sorting domain-containing protein [Microscillaceae bacterium]
MKTFFYLLVLLVSSPMLLAQPLRFAWQNQIPLKINGQALDLAWAGGLNAPQFSTLDLNQDGKADLVVFDRSNGKLYTFLVFLVNGQARYQYAPQYENFFPTDLKGWILLRDYDGDGRKDIFTHTNLGIRVFRNQTLAGQYPAWQLVAEPLMTQGYRGLVNLQVNIMDVPALADVDGDGDLDIVSFDFATGSWLEWHKNESVEQFGNREHLVFRRESSCWGGLIEGATCGAFSFGYECEVPGNGGGGGNPDNRILHVGSTLALHDVNGDGLLDALIGDVACPEVYLMYNVGTLKKARFESVSTAFPDSKALQFSTFPALFFEDVDADGKADLLAAPNLFVNEGNQIDFENSVWYYKNESDSQVPDFVFQSQDFLQSQMLDVGEQAFPALADDDGDGDLDLFVGQKGRLQAGRLVARLMRFENTGTAQNPVFEKTHDDWLGLSAELAQDFKLFFQDLNGDQSLDAGWVFTQNGQTQVQYFPNQAPRGQAFRFEPQQRENLPLTLQAGDFPHFFDWDGDGDLDALVGRRLGGLAYYENTGTAFVLQQEGMGQIQNHAFARLLTPIVADLDGDGLSDLLTGDAGGKLRFYANARHQPAPTWTASMDIFENAAREDFIPENLGTAIFPALGDLNGDQKPDLVVGLATGGLRIAYNQTDGFFADPAQTEIPGLYVFPNPADSFIYLRYHEAMRVQLSDGTGKMLGKPMAVEAGKEATLDVRGWPPGTYLLRIEVPGQPIFHRKILLNP